MSKKEIPVKVENEILKAKINILTEQLTKNGNDRDYLNQQQKDIQNEEKPLTKKEKDIIITEMNKLEITAYKIGKTIGMSQTGVINRLKKMGLWKPKEKGNQYKKTEK